MTFCAFSGIAQVNESDTLKTDTVFLKEVQIEENIISYPFSRSSRDIEIIQAKQIKNMPIQSLPEILSYQPSVDIRQRGPVGVQADISLRGGTFEQTLVLLNGIKMSDPQTGHHVMNVPIMYDNIDRVEIIKGAAAKRYGQNAYAGAINFITRVPDSNRLSLRTYVGDFRSGGANLSFSNKNEKQGHYLSLGADVSNGYTYNTDFEILNAFYQGEFTLGENGHFDLIAGLSDREFGANAFYASSIAKDQYEEVRTGLASISYTHLSRKWKVSPRLAWRNNDDDYLFIRQKPEIYQNKHTTNTYSAELNASNENILGTTGLGVEFRKETIKGDWIRSGVFSKSNLDGFSRENIGLYAEHKYLSDNGKFDIAPGAYLAWYSDFDIQFFPGIEAGYWIDPQWKIYASIGKSFRIPSFYDQYYESPVEVGNPNIQPEEAWTYESAIRFVQKTFYAEANIYYRDNQNLIDWALNEDTVWVAGNFTKVVSKGWELSLYYEHPIYLIANEVYFERLSFHYAGVDQEHKLKNENSRYALEHLTNQFIAIIDINLIKQLKANIAFRNIHRVQQDPYTLIDVKIYWRAKYMDVFAQVNNLGNVNYMEVMTPMPGRWLRLGFNLQIPY